VLVTTNFLQDLIPRQCQCCSPGLPRCCRRGDLHSWDCTEPKPCKTELKGLEINLLKLGEPGMTELRRAKLHVLVESGKSGCC